MSHSGSCRRAPGTAEHVPSSSATRAMLFGGALFAAGLAPQVCAQSWQLSDSFNSICGDGPAYLAVGACSYAGSDSCADTIFFGDSLCGDEFGAVHGSTDFFNFNASAGPMHAYAGMILDNLPYETSGYSLARADIRVDIVQDTDVLIEWASDDGPHEIAIQIRQLTGPDAPVDVFTQFLFFSNGSGSEMLTLLSGESYSIHIRLYDQSGWSAGHSGSAFGRVTVIPSPPTAIALFGILSPRRLRRKDQL